MSSALEKHGEIGERHRYSSLAAQFVGAIAINKEGIARPERSARVLIRRACLASRCDAVGREQIRLAFAANQHRRRMPRRAEGQLWRVEIEHTVPDRKESAMTADREFAIERRQHRGGIRENDAR